MMSDQITAIPSPSPATNRRLKIALAVSVALNLAIAGLIGGIALHGGPGGRGDMMVRDFGFGTFDGALRPEDKEALRKSIQGKLGDIRAARQQMQADGTAILAALRAEPFDKAVLAATLAQQSLHFNDRLKFGSQVISDFLLGLSPEERVAFADRLEHRMSRGRDDDPKADGGN
jgi:uncharacterized membrane protein